ncbi:MAG: hypothetical protein WCA22_16580 [Candidatus Binatus sp.]
MKIEMESASPMVIVVNSECEGTLMPGKSRKGIGDFQADGHDRADWHPDDL